MKIRALKVARHLIGSTDCLLGDIRTFLDGIEYFKIQNKGEPAGKSPRGGGNLSVPILINTALEFISDLYAGKTQDDYMKFSLHKEESYVSDLNDGNIPEDLKKEFEKRRFPLPKNHVVDVIPDKQEWKIKNTTDTESNCYFINLTDNGKKLKIHFFGKEEYQADNIVEPFINAFFPKEYREIPRLLWDGIRNGLVHTFSPKPFEYKGSYIKFQFYVEDQNFPSHIEKVKGYLFNVEDARAKLETDLNKDNVPKELEDKFKTMNLPLPESPTARKGKEEKKWEITNGEATLYALEKEDKEKITVYNYIIRLRINVFELFRVLEKAVEAYRAELENSDDLQDKFIRAWSSIEEYTEKTDEKQEKEVNELNKCLDQKKHAFLLKNLNDQLSVDSLKIYSLNSLKVRRS